MTAVFYPDGAPFNGVQNTLSDQQMARLKVGEPFGDNEFNPIIYSSL
jgi:hypothetical protein